jgi:citrate lyase subunit beta/citryl-CoA lyase
MSAHRPRRSCLYMPGANERALEKAKTLSADTLIFDLEDAVAPDAKLAARETIAAALAGGGYGPREIVIRINGLDTEWGHDDLRAAVAAGPDAILAPKVIDGGEMPRAIFNLKDIAETAGRTRLTTFVMGTNDLAKELRAVNDPPTRTAFQTALSLSVAAARAYDLVAIDGVYNGIGDEEGLAAECRQGRLMGFDGKTLIHPSQLATANEVFAPAPEDVEQARAVMAAFADPANAGKGVLKVNGKMTELLHLEEARRTVEVAEAIAQMES